MTLIQRRSFLAGAAASLAPLPAAAQGTIELPFANGTRPLVQLPGKRPMIGLTARPPQLETPFEVFDEGVLTPNDAFFVRYHLSQLPTSIDPASYRLSVQGHVERMLSLSLEELKRDFPVQEIVAVNQCSGNSRGFFEPRVGGGQLGHGAMGNARWTGVPLRAVLDRAGLRAGAVQVAFKGLDKAPLKAIPDYEKALDIDNARDGEVMLAFAMNGEDLPFLNGYPLRLIVPGYYGTYWIKHLSEITVLDAAFEGYWVKSAYRIPDNECACVAPGGKPDSTRSIGRFNIRSFITSHADGAKVKAGPIELRGIAFNGGEGIARVQVSPDGGASWQEARLGEDLGRYSFRQWSLALPLAVGRHAVKVRAYSPDGTTQPLEPLWQPAGYMRNVVETVTLEAA
ncbi:molybdopterin-dependent oxidoreductase [Altererythrobacter sp. CC-YST694]|uniref:SorA family sulfite dehydrogenase catalytic subunit n=1 Tax=Altererythrobacter sp. CC-YST694 TaxID=2755038 RepID=UPI001D01A31A|nr:molybdopterin-dependent oxidoreductase [Altererythrobacter sp. CC-YST694]MCB5426393.1 molybdopterin-dependent oxidoreductase [Altererythrobacter sp. CC-YST694]